MPQDSSRQPTGPDAERAEPRGPGMTVFVMLLLLIAGLGFLAYSMLGSGHGDAGAAAGSSRPPSGTPTPASPAGAPGPASTMPASGGVEVNIAYGTEKKLWLDWAAQEFARTDEGRGIRVNLVGMGSVEGAQAVLNGPGATPIHVWSPASSAYRDVFEAEWAMRHGGGKPVLRADNLALTPMIFIFWKERYEAMGAKWKPLSFRTIGDAMQETSGWAGLANRPDWGLFKFAHTHPDQSNSGLVTLLLMAYEQAGKESGLALSDITKPEFQAWMQRFERGIARPGGELSNSTGTLMREMVLRGPGQYDGLMVYENLAIDYLKAAQGRWGELIVLYPEVNYWNENPYYILDVPWSSAAQRRAASAFLDFLLTEPVQRKALEHGFRPGNPSVPIKFPESPFVLLAPSGLRIDVPRVGEAPKAEVLRNLLASFQRISR